MTPCVQRKKKWSSRDTDENSLPPLPPSLPATEPVCNSNEEKKMEVSDTGASNVTDADDNVLANWAGV